VGGGAGTAFDARDVVVDDRHIVVAGDQGIFLRRHTP
jgi:hypothetical protein